MVFTQEQAEKIKQQLFSQIDNSDLPNKIEIRQQIEKMNESQLEEFLKQQQEAVSSQSESSEPEKCVFCSIINNELSSYKIEENKNSIAILEINPLSRGHSIILPLKHISIEKLQKSVLGLAQKIAKKIKAKLKPQDVKIETSSFQGHAMVNIIPIYKDKKLEKYKASEKELNEIQTLLKPKKRVSRNKNTTSKNKISNPSKILKLNRRIP